MKNATFVVSSSSYRIIRDNFVGHKNVNIVDGGEQRKIKLKPIFDTKPDIVILDQYFENSNLVYLVDVFKCCQIPMVIASRKYFVENQNLFGFKVPTCNFQTLLKRDDIIFPSAFQEAMAIINAFRKGTDNENHYPWADTGSRHEIPLGIAS